MTSGRLKVIVKDIKYESPSVKSFKLWSADDSLLPRFSGGSHITTYVMYNDRLIERHYSLINDSKADGYYQIAVQRSEQSRGGSVYWNDYMKEGDQLEISYPRSHFPLSFEAKHHMFFAAGIGITPFLAMMRELKKQGKSFELHYASPSREMCAFFADLITMYPRQVHFYFSSEKNRMSPKIMENQYIGTHVYFCGSAQMMKEYAAEARKYGYPAKNIHYEWFETQHTGPLNAFQVKLGRSGKILEVPENESLLNTLLACGVEIPYACKIGGCGSCQIDVVDGEVDHRDSFLNDEERVAKKVIIACVSRAQKGIVVLDL